MNFLSVDNKVRSISPNAKQEARRSRFSFDDPSKLNKKRSDTPTVATMYRIFQESCPPAALVEVESFQKRLEKIPEVAVKEIGSFSEGMDESKISVSARVKTDLVAQKERQNSAELSHRKRSGSLVESLRGKVEAVAGSPKSAEGSSSAGITAIKTDMAFQQERQNSGELSARKRAGSLVGFFRETVEAQRDSTS